MSVKYVTDEVKALIGAHAGPFLAYHPVEASEVRRFFQSIMDPNPRFWDEAWAARSRYGSIVAPPVFPVLAFRRPPTVPDRLDRFKDDPNYDARVSNDNRGLPPLNLPLNRGLNGGYEYELFRYAKVGERIYRSSTYLDVYQREGRSGTMVFILTADMYTTDGGVPLITSTTTSIMR